MKDIRLKFNKIEINPAYFTIFIKNKKKYIYFNSKWHEIDPNIISCYKNYKDIIRVKLKHQNSYKTSYLKFTDNKISMSQIFDDGLDFNEGYASVKLGAYWGFVDEDFITHEIKYKRVFNFYNNVALVLDEKNKWVSINKNFISLKTFKHVFSYSEGIVLEQNGTTCRYLTPDKKVLAKGFAICWPMQNGMAMVRENGGIRLSFINNLGQILPQFNELNLVFPKNISSFKNGIIKISLPDNEVCYINKNAEIIATGFQDGSDFVGKTALVKTKSGKYNCIDQQGKFLFSEHIVTNEMSPIVENAGAVKLDDGQYAVIDSNGEYMIDSNLIKDMDTVLELIRYDPNNIVLIPDQFFNNKINIAKVKNSVTKYFLDNHFYTDSKGIIQSHAIMKMVDDIILSKIKKLKNEILVTNAAKGKEKTKENNSTSFTF